MSKTPNIPGYTAEELADLTPDEIAALENEHLAGNPGDAADLAELAGEGAEGGDAAGTEGKAEGEHGAAGAAEGATETAEEPGDAPAYVANAPQDAEAQIKAQRDAIQTAKTAEKEALKKLHDGEIDFEEYDKIRNTSDTAIEAANEKLLELNLAINRAQVAEEMTQQQLSRAWKGEVAELMKAAATEGLDYKGNAELNKELNGLVRAFGMEATERGMTDEGLKASKWALQQAHATMKLRHPELVKAAPAPAAGAKPGEAAGKPADGKRHNLATLASMPNADRPLGDTDDIAKFGQLEGEELEKAIAGMSPAQVEKLMASV